MICHNDIGLDLQHNYIYMSSHPNELCLELIAELIKI